MKKNTFRVSCSLMRKLMLVALLFLLSGALSACAGHRGKAHPVPTVGQQLTDLKNAHDQGAITEEEYNSVKKKILEAPHAKCSYCKKAGCKKAGCKKAGCKKAECKKRGCEKGAKHSCPHSKAEVTSGQCSADFCPHKSCTHQECQHKDCPGKHGGTCPLKEKSDAKK